MNLPELLPALALIGFASVACGQDGSLDVTGSAFARGSGELLYRELHDCTQDATLCRVDYRDAADALIAQKRLDYSVDPYQPLLSMRDLRGDRDFSYIPDPQSPLVVDAGFDNFVRGRWQELVEGQELHFRFVVLGIDRPLKMKALRRDGCEEGELCLDIMLDSWLLGRFVDPIELSYALDDRRLLRFSGVSNIRGADGEKLDVNIVYEYSEPAGSRAEARDALGISQ